MQIYLISNNRPTPTLKGLTGLLNNSFYLISGAYCIDDRVCAPGGIFGQMI